MRKLAILLLLLFSGLGVISNALIAITSVGGGFTIIAYPVYHINDAGYAYNISDVTFLTVDVNLTGTFKYNSSFSPNAEFVVFYSGLGEVLSGGAASYVQPVIGIELTPKDGVCFGKL